MVKTRRSESSSLAPENGPRCQTRETIVESKERELGSSCDSFNAEQEEESDQGEEESWSSPEKSIHVGGQQHRPASPLVTARPRELRSRFVCDGKEYTRRHLRKVCTATNSRRHHHNIYESRKMRNIIDSDMDDCYSPRISRSNRNRYGRLTKSSQLERRAALSLRPIMQKSYKDLDNCNTDDSEVLRPPRTRRRDRNESWIGDNQMHKVGYPSLHQYSDDDSRDAEAHVTRKRSRNMKYLYGYEPSAEKNLRSRTRGESQDKENNEDNVNFLNGHVRTQHFNLKHDQDVKEESNKDKSDADTEDNVDKVENDESKDDQVEETKETQEQRKDAEEQQSLSESELIGPITRTRKRKRKLSTSSSEVVKSYSLRERRAKPLPKYSARIERLQPSQKCTISRYNSRFNHRRNIPSSDSDSDSSDSNCRRNNTYNKTQKNTHSKNEQLRTGAGHVLPIAPETLDPKITFKSVGGLKEHVQCLKEMILLPMMYPDVFARFQIQPSRGVLFHGPPGTGKTLLARALANECSFGSKKVSFFMRKGADLLSKWIGESEKQLRILFEQAAEKKPSIIFFDELDGLAPVRSSRQDQVHASIVSTLLALMDGLTNRGEIIVVGATNRIDAIDPALRRPGRFDRELFFPLPSQIEREEILRVHLNQWNCPPADSLVSYLAENSVGYCGSDLRALCSEAVIQSFRRTYPQVYSADYRLLINPDSVKVEKIDFLRAKSVLVPASHRVTESVSNKLSSIVKPLLEKSMKDVLDILQSIFPHGLSPNLAKVKLSANVRPAQMLICANGSGYGNSTYLAPALLHHMEHIHSYILDLASLHREGGRSPEEACIQIFHEAKRNVPSIIYIPNIDTLWRLANETVIGIFLTQLKQIGANNPILLLATSDTLYDSLPDELQNMFSLYRKEVYEMKKPDKISRRMFFEPLLKDVCRRPPKPERPKVHEYPELPKAPTPPPVPITAETAKKLYEEEEKCLRELRIFLREVCKKLASNKLFYLFTKPVDTDEVPDYPTIIKEPMDLETMMTKVDFHRYESAKDFLNDIELICRNALEYNPARTSADKQIRHRACALRDYAFTLIKSEMDSDFETKCQEISHKRQKRNIDVAEYKPPYMKLDVEEPPAQEEESNTKPENETVKPVVVQNGVVNHISRASPHRRRKTSSWCRGNLKKRKRNSSRNTSGEAQPQGGDKNSSDDDSKQDDDKIDAENSKSGKEMTEVNKDKNVKYDMNDFLSPSDLLEDPLEFDDIDKTLNESNPQGFNDDIEVEIREEELEQLLVHAVSLTENKDVTSILDLHFQLSRIIKNYMKSVDRMNLPMELVAELKRYKRAQNIDGGSLNSSEEFKRSSSSLSHVSESCSDFFTRRK